MPPRSPLRPRRPRRVAAPAGGLEDFTARLAEARSEGHAAGVAAERARFAELADMADGHPSFVMEQFKGGANVATAAKAYGTLLKTQAQQARSLDPSNGVPPLNVGPSGSASGDPERIWEGNVDGVQAQYRNKADFIALAKHRSRIAALKN